MAPLSTADATRGGVFAARPPMPLSGEGGPLAGGGAGGGASRSGSTAVACSGLVGGPLASVGGGGSGKGRGGGGGSGSDGGSGSGRRRRGSSSSGGEVKKRLVWTPELHERFINAINAVGLPSAVPKKVLQIMNVDGLTTEHVKSHLQKYRNSLKRERAAAGDKKGVGGGRVGVGGLPGVAGSTSGDTDHRDDSESWGR